MGATYDNIMFIEITCLCMYVICVWMVYMCICICVHGIWVHVCLRESSRCVNSDALVYAQMVEVRRRLGVFLGYSIPLLGTESLLKPGAHQFD